MKRCPCCGFCNSDERERCLKCGAVLQHDWLAAQRKVRLRRFPLHRVTAAIADAWYAVRRLLVFPLPEHCPYRYPWMAGFLALLPGLGQLYNRQNRKALLFFAVFLAALSLAVVTVLNPLSYVFIGALIAWVLYSFNDAMVTATKIDGQEWTYGYTIASYSALFFYLGVFISLSQFFLVGLFGGFILYCLYSAFWSAREVNRAKILTTAGVAFGFLILCCLLARSGNPVLHRWVYWSQDVLDPTIRKGDFIYVDCFSYWFHPPRLGDIAYYNARPYSIAQGENIYSVRLRRTLERIVALPGDHFASRGGRFFRNDVPVPPGLAPLHPAGLPGNFEFDVPQDRYLVLISFGPSDSIPGLGAVTAPSPREGGSPDWGSACLVARNEMYGRCLLIWHPISRRRWLTPAEMGE